MTQGTVARRGAVRAALILSAAAVGTAGVAGAQTPEPSAQAPSLAAAPAPVAVAANVRDKSLRYGQKVIVRGRSAQGAGAPVRLEYRPRTEDAWTAIDTARAGKNGRFSLTARLSRSGFVRTVDGAVPFSAAETSAPQPAGQLVRVRAHLRIRKAPSAFRPGDRVAVAGTLRRQEQGRKVTLERRGARRWVRMDTARTAANGRFRLTAKVSGVNGRAVRVRFAGDQTNTAVTRKVGTIASFRPALASWYGPGLFGNPLGCAGYGTLQTGTVGAAHKSLPCGTMVTFKLGNRVVRAPILDRGPYVGAREFDLTQALKQQLGFGSTGIVQVSY